MGRTYSFQGVTLVIPDAYSALDLSALLQPSSAGTGIVALVGESNGGSPGLTVFPGGSTPTTIVQELLSGPGANCANLALRAGVDQLVQAGASLVYFYQTNNSAPAVLPVYDAGSPTLPVLSTTGTTVINTTAVTALGSIAGLYIGQRVFGAGIPFGTTIAAITSGSAITLSQEATASATGVALTFGWAPAFTLQTKLNGASATLYNASILQVSGFTYLTTYDQNGASETSIGVGSQQYVQFMRSSAGGASSATIQLAYNAAGKLILTGVSSLGTEFTLDVTTLTLAQVQSTVESNYPTWTVTIVSPAFDALLMTNMDLVLTPQNCYNTVSYSMVASLYELNAWVNANSKNATMTLGSLNNAQNVPVLNLASFNALNLGSIAGATLLTMTMQTTDGILPNMSVSGTGIPAGTQVVSVVGNIVTLSQETTASSSGATYTFSGARGSSTNASVQAGFNALLSVNLNIIAPLFSSDDQDGSTITASSVFAQLKGHLDNRGSILGRSEAQGYLGVHGNLAVFQSTCQAMNDRWVTVTSQNITDVDINGNTIVYPEYGLAVVYCQTQAGSPVGTPLTYRQIPSLGINQDISWTPAEDAPQIILFGGSIAAYDEFNVLRIVNGYTSWTADTNNANIFIETVGSLAQFCRNHRQFMKQRFLGQSSFTAQSVIDAITESENAEVNTNKTIVAFDPTQTILFSTSNGILNYQVAVEPFEGIIFVLPVVVAYQANTANAA